MSEEPDVRVGTAERERAQRELNEHFSLGRLEMAEFEQRSSQVAAARTSSELRTVFLDLPRTPAVVEPQPAAPVVSRQSWRYGVVGAMPFIAVALFFLLSGHSDNAWLVFLLVPLSGTVLNGGAQRSRRHRRDRPKD